MRPILSSPFTLALVLVIAAGAGWWLIAARRGRRVGETPFCRKCGFDLTGKPVDSTRCAECGADVTTDNAVVIGRRIPRRGATWAAVLVLVPSLLFASLLGYGKAKGVDWRRYAPTSWVLQEARGPASSSALLELKRRANDKQLSLEEWASIVDAGLAEQADTSKPWLPAWGDLIESARATQNATDEQWTQYAQNTLSTMNFSLVARSLVLRGNRVPLTYQRGATRTSKARFTLYVKSIAGAVDAKPVRFLWQADQAEMLGTFSIDPNSAGGSYPTPLVWAEDVNELPAGEHVVTRELSFTIGDTVGNGLSYNSPTTLPAGFVTLATVTRRFDARFILAEVADGPPTVTTDPKLRDAIRSAFTIDHVQRKKDTLEIEYTIGTTPVRLAVKPLFRRSGETAWRDFASRSWGSRSNGTNGVVDYASATTDIKDLPPGARIDVVLRPQLEEYTNDLDTRTGWGEELIFSDLLIEDAPGTAK